MSENVKIVWKYSTSVLFVAAFDKNTQEYRFITRAFLTFQDNVCVCWADDASRSILKMRYFQNKKFWWEVLHDDLYYWDAFLDNAKKETSLHEHHSKRFETFNRVNCKGPGEDVA